MRPRVVHLLNPSTCGDEGLLACARAMSIPGALQEAWILGTSDDHRLAARLGVHSTSRVRSCALRSLTARRLRSLWDARGFDDAPVPTIVQAWCIDSLALARRALSRRRALRLGVLLRPPTEPVHNGPARARFAFAVQGATLLALDLRSRDAHAEVAGERHGGLLLLDNIRVCEEPWFDRDAPPLSALNRADIRASLGIDPGETVVAMLADPPASQDISRLAFAMGLGRVCGHSLVGLARRGGEGDRRAARFTVAHGRRWRLVLADLTLPELLAAADVGIADLHDHPARDHVTPCGPTALSLAMSMGVPIAAPTRVVVPRLKGPPWVFRPSPTEQRARVMQPAVELLEHVDLRAQATRLASELVIDAQQRDGFRTTLSELWHELCNLPAPPAHAHTPRELAELEPVA